MNHIKLLDKETASKIAAGEVIERPAAVLKELLENSLDAGATVINIDIEKAGKKLIRVNDNGSGIPSEDLPNAILRHTTSKINNFEDLNTLNTFGFRGEALYSVSAISKLTIASYNTGDNGAKIMVEGGAVKGQSIAPKIPGTTVEVRDLFFNTPARLKFLKSDAVERAHLLRTAEEAALANPQTAFNIKTDGTKVYSLPAAKPDEKGLRNRIAKILGEDMDKNLLYIEDAKYNFKAFISPASQLTAARDEQFFFINRRPLSAKILQQAVYRAYQPYRAKDKHPIVVLFMQMPPDEFDVNIHPQKKEIKFVAESEVFNFLQRKLSSAILSQSGAEQINLAAVAAQNNTAALPPASKEPVNIPPVPPLYGFNDTADATQPATTAEALSLLLNANIENKATTFEMRDFEDPKKYNIEPTLSDGSFCYPKNDTAIEPTTSASEELAHETADKNTPAWWRPPYNYIGQLHKSYLLFENPQGLVLVDQHAAQERVFFEEYLNSLENKNTERQPLMFPLTVQMAASQIENLLAWQDFLEQAGFEISRFSAGSLLVNSVPNILKFKDEALKDFILQFAAVAGNPNKASKELKYKLIATMACKKSIKAGEQLEREQAAALMQNLKNCDDGLHCPHGRPTLLVLSMEEISKKIGRG